MTSWVMTFAAAPAVLLFLTTALRSAPKAPDPAPVPPAEAQRLARQVMPLLQQKCLACHGEDPKKIKGGLDLRTRKSTLAGGENGDVLVPGDAAGSRLYVAVTYENIELEMPPKEKDRLTKEQVALVRKWIEAGAPWPE